MRRCPLFSTYVVGLTLAGEMKNMALCATSIERNREVLGRLWTFSLNFCLDHRRFVFVPGVCMSVGLLVLTKGGGALDVCFNTVSVLFLVEIDNISYRIGLGELAKNRMGQFGRVPASDEEATSLATKKAIFVPVETCIVVKCITTDGHRLLSTISWNVSLNGTGQAVCQWMDSAESLPQLLPKLLAGLGKSALAFIMCIVVMV